MVSPAAAGSGRFDFLKEDAVPRAADALGFVEAGLAVDLAAVAFVSFFRRQLEMFGEPADFLVAHPHVTGPASAAVSATGAGEFQTLFVPHVGLGDGPGVASGRV